MPRVSLHSRIEGIACLVAAATASVSILGAAVMLFVGEGSTPWFPQHSPLARAAEHCDARLGSRRHECLRELALRSEAATSVAMDLEGDGPADAPGYEP